MLGKTCTTSKILKASSSSHRAETMMHSSRTQRSDGGALLTHAERAKPGVPGKQTRHILWNHGWLVTVLKDNKAAQRPVFIFSFAFMFWTVFATEMLTFSERQVCFVFPSGLSHRLQLFALSLL